MNDEETIKNIFDLYVDFWNKNDIENWGKLFTDDTDFVIWSGKWFKSNQENVQNHQQAHDTLKEQGQNMTYTLSVSNIDFLNPEIALVHANWEWKDFKVPNGVENRRGILSMIMVKRSNSWLIRSTHNTRIDKIPE